MFNEIAMGVATGIATHKTIEVTEETARNATGHHPPTVEEILVEQTRLLKVIASALSPKEDPDINVPMNLQPYPSEYVQEDHGKPHTSIFCPAAIAARIDVPGAGTYQKTIGPGWVACDLPAGSRFSATDVNQHPVIFSYRDEEIGTGL